MREDIVKQELVYSPGLFVLSGDFLFCYREEVIMQQNKVLNVRNVVLIGMFGALAAVLETFQIPVPFAPPFYKLDFAETPILIGAFALGPVPAVLMELVKNLLKLLIKGTSTMYVGDLGNFIGGCAFVLPASIIYQRHKTKKTALISMGASIVAAIIAAIFVNCFLTIPTYAKLMFGSMDSIIAMGTAINPAIKNLPTFALFAVVPFNLLKCSLNAFITALLYKHVSVILHSGLTARKAKAPVKKG